MDNRYNGNNQRQYYNQGNNRRYDQSRQNGDYRNNFNEPEKPSLPECLPTDYVDQAEKVMKYLRSEKDRITTSKIRNLFSLVMDIYNVENLRNEKMLLDSSVSSLMMLRVRFVYEMGRDYGVRSFMNTSKMLDYVKNIGTDRGEFIRLAQYMEALVAYHRLLIGGREG